MMAIKVCAKDLKENDCLSLDFGNTTENFYVTKVEKTNNDSVLVTLSLTVEMKSKEYWYPYREENINV
jgi:hypothetical protein